MRSFLQSVFLFLIFHCKAQITRYNTESTTAWENELTSSDSSNNEEIIGENIFPLVLRNAEGKIIGTPQKKEPVIIKVNNEFARLIPGPRKSKFPLSGEFVHLVPLPEIDSAMVPQFKTKEEKWDILLQSFIDEEFIYCKKFDSTGKLTSYITSARGFHCTFFPLSCIDFSRGTNGNIICRIHNIKQEPGTIKWNCTGGNLIFGCDTLKTKVSDEKQVAGLSECFRQRRASYKKDGDTICFKMNLVDGKKTKETWKVIKENNEEIIIEKIKEENASFYCPATACPKKLKTEGNSPADTYYKTSLLLE
ncbi:MAG: hypothetical protein IAF38_20495 [Bacteroidia bacterium]|nr:hypothetical protein [Bacteroidia bacterium]